MNEVEETIVPNSKSKLTSLECLIDGGSSTERLLAGSPGVGRAKAFSLLADRKVAACCWLVVALAHYPPSSKAQDSAAKPEDSSCSVTQRIEDSAGYK